MIDEKHHEHRQQAYAAARSGAPRHIQRRYAYAAARAAVLPLLMLLMRLLISRHTICPRLMR